LAQGSEPTPHELLAQLEDQFVLGEILESEYKQFKWELLQIIRDSGEEVQEVTGLVTRAEIFDSLGRPFCQIPGGPFMAGDDNTLEEMPADLFLGKYPITQEDFLDFLGDSGHHFPQEDLERLYLVSPEPDCPVSHISWEDAKSYCRWLRRQTKEYYSLPTELEWEKAARGEDGRFFPWGTEPMPDQDIACFQGPHQYNCTVPVTTFPGNRAPYGCMDMIGNVWEFCLDSVDDPRDPHILRGGSWCNTLEYTNCLSRTFSYPATKRIDFGGFRIVYLPEDSLVEYRRKTKAAAVEAAAPVPKKRKKLKVIRMATEQPESAPVPTTASHPKRKRPKPGKVKVDHSVRDQVIEMLSKKNKGAPGTPAGDVSSSSIKTSLRPLQPSLEVFSGDDDSDELADDVARQAQQHIRQRGEAATRAVSPEKSKKLFEYEALEEDEDAEDGDYLDDIPPTPLTYLMFAVWVGLWITILVMFTRLIIGA